MSLLGPIIIGAIIGIIGAILKIIADRKSMSQSDEAYYDDDDYDEDDEDDDDEDWEDSEYRSFNPWRDSSSGNRKQSNYDPFGNHWESSFDWKDEDNDGYDDRDDGFWNEREF